ncbi:uncharacterized protein LOC132759560 [Ruditapes philippinarum]|uniref:uncharacterized protein LOC132759560 n=1 Tax=Ruditapes philippinarum TaxID=129788 RepID=UPI00295AE6D3|nr:uncharacterized protein LOC132759560 [Ruditapes philippinarum]
MATPESFALMIWINDNPVTGNAVRIRQIVEPRKAYHEYRDGETVKVKLARFGIVEGVIAKLGDGTEESKKILEKEIDSPKFIDLVKKYCPNVQRSETVTEETASANTALCTAENKKRKSSKPRAITEKKKKYDLEKAGEELQLAKLKEQVHTGSQNTHSRDVTPPLLTEIRKSTESSHPFNTSTNSAINTGDETLPLQTEIERSAEPCPPLISNTNSGLDIGEVSIPFQIETSRSTEGCHQLSSSTSSAVDIGGPESVFSTVRKSIDVVSHQGIGMVDLLNQPLEQQRECDGCSHLKQEVANLRQYVLWLEGRAMTEIQNLRSSISWLFENQKDESKNVDRQIGESVTNKFFTETKPADQASEMEVLVESIEEHPNTFYNNFTKAQLRVIAHAEKSFSKAAKALFRKMFTMEEVKGRSLSGFAPNKNTPAKPALENQEKLQALYKIVQEKWPWASKAMINLKLADLLKPSYQPKSSN